jgi:Flp pilus assembly pilin Flp
MKGNIYKIGTRFARSISADCGQSMTEYALICALLAFGATAGYQGLASEVASAFNQISSLFDANLGTGGGAGTGSPPAGGAGHSGDPGGSGGPGGLGHGGGPGHGGLGHGHGH